MFSLRFDMRANARADRVGIGDEAFLRHLRQGTADVFQGLLDL